MIFRKLRIWLLAGIIVLLPLWLTVFAFIWSFQYVDQVLTAPITEMMGVQVPGIGVGLAILIFLVAGWLTTHLLGRQMIRLGEAFIFRIPMVRAIYSAVKQMTEAVLTPKGQSFSRVVLVEYPRRGVYSVGFAAGELPGTGLMRVWIPPGPSPTAGPLVLIPAESVVGLPMSVEDGLKLIVSAGAFTPGPADLVAIEAAVKEIKQRSADP